MIFLFVPAAFGLVVTTNLDENQLPIIIPYNITFQAQNGDVIIFNHTSKSFIANLSFPENISFTNVTILNVTINISIPFFVNISINPFVFNDTVNALNIISLNSTDIVFSSSVLYNLSNITSQQNTSTISTSSDRFLIRTFDILLPDNINQNITIVGKPNITVEVTCTGQFITICPSNFLPTDSQPSKIINIDISISNQTSVGNYTSFVVFKQDNSTKTVTFDIEILRSTTIVRSITEIINEDECAKDIKECARRYSLYFAQVAQAVIDAENSKGQCTNQTIEKEKIVVTGSIDDILFRDHQNIQSENRKLTSQLTESTDNLVICRSNLGEMQTKFGTETTYLKEQSFKSSQDAAIFAILEKEKLRKQTLTYIGIFIASAISIFGVYYSGKRMWWW